MERSTRFKEAVARFNDPSNELLYKDPYYGRAIAHTFSDYGYDDEEYKRICKMLKVPIPKNGCSAHKAFGSMSAAHRHGGPQGRLKRDSL